MKNRELDIAWARSRKSTDWNNSQTTWDEVVDHLSETTYTDETVAEYHAASREVQTEIKDIGGFVAGRLTDGKRKKDAVEHRSMVVLDADNADDSLWTDYTNKIGCEAVMYSTHSHTKKHQRFRLVIPLARDVDPFNYERLAANIINLLGIERFDGSSIELNRLMYWPSTPSDGEYIFKHHKGEWLDPDDFLKLQFNRDVLIEERASSSFVLSTSKTVNPEDKPGMVGVFNKKYSIPEAIRQFLGHIYSPLTDNRYTYLKGTTEGGLVIYDDGYAYTFHDTDPVNGALRTAYDLVRIHKFGHLDKSLPTDTPYNQLPSEKAMREFVKELDDDQPIDEPQNSSSIALKLEEAQGTAVLERLNEMTKANKQQPVIKTGLPNLDRALGGGLYPGVYTLMGAPGLGKSSLALQIADHVSQSGSQVFFFSLEMDSRNLVSKIISRLSYSNFKHSTEHLTFREISDGSLHSNFPPKKAAALQTAKDMYSVYADNMRLFSGREAGSMGTITKCVDEFCKSSNERPLVVIDYLQRIRSPKSSASERKIIDDNVAAVKHLSEKYNLPIILISSMSRTFYGNNTDITIDAAKESGSIEYDSEAVLALQLKGIGAPKFNIDAAMKAKIRELEIKVLKNRYGQAGDRAPTYFNPTFSHYS